LKSFIKTMMSTRLRLLEQSQLSPSAFFHLSEKNYNTSIDIEFSVNLHHL
ncbi:hypothetical protein T11_6303, partial [Trichinella zimbabwensis]